MGKAIEKRERCGLLIVMWLGLIMSFVFLGSANDVAAYAIEPIGTPSGDAIYDFESEIKGIYNDRKFAEHVIRLVKDPVHECATNMVYDENFENYDYFNCKKYKKKRYAPNSVLAGVQWNDNPPFVMNDTDEDLCLGHVANKTVIMLPYAAACWYVLFRDGSKKGRKGVEFNANSEKKYVILYRVHYGDLQFIHSMATKDGEAPEETKETIMAWAEFTYKLANKELSRWVKLADLKIEKLRRLFYNKGWNAQDLFIRDRTYHADKKFRNFVFGALLHTIQDSFVVSHTKRAKPSGECEGFEGKHYAPGRIKQFYSYVNQDDDKHAEYDKMKTFLKRDLNVMPPSCVEVGKALRSFYENGVKWDEGVKQYLNCVFDLYEDTEKSGPGEFALKVRQNGNVRDDEPVISNE